MRSPSPSRRLSRAQRCALRKRSRRSVSGKKRNGRDIAVQDLLRTFVYLSLQLAWWRGDEVGGSRWFPRGERAAHARTRLSIARLEQADVRFTIRGHISACRQVQLPLHSANRELLTRNRHFLGSSRPAAQNGLFVYAPSRACKSQSKSK